MVKLAQSLMAASNPLRHALGLVLSLRERGCGCRCRCRDDGRASVVEPRPIKGGAPCAGHGGWQNEGMDDVCQCQDVASEEILFRYC